MLERPSPPKQIQKTSRKKINIGNYPTFEAYNIYFTSITNIFKGNKMSFLDSVNSLIVLLINNYFDNVFRILIILNNFHSMSEYFFMIIL